jgi:hypothetical protein
MFTIKLCRGHVTKLVQADEIDIYPSGPAPNSDSDPSQRTNDIREIAIRLGDRTEAYYITHCKGAGLVSPHIQGWDDGTQFFDTAYIENDKGATTEIVRPY